MATAAPYGPAHVASIYRRALRLSLNWTIRRDIWRQQALAIRAQFDANKGVTDPRIIRNLIVAGERELELNRHPDPYIPPSRPGGSKYERNAQPPLDKPIGGDY
ncbi:uncharacterized protein V1518DRAFT_436564 [Limtongia smithiae]|uniref:uncharacterized protein n=1 Tax=Limtongia smithiae TaxID=1125753 RepID=UPI0034CE99B2